VGIVKRDRFDEFSARFDVLVREEMAVCGEPDETYLVDAEMAIADATTATAKYIAQCAPFGMGNDEPLFAFPRVRIASARPVGKTMTHIKVTFADADDARATVDAIGFSLAEKVMQLGENALVNVIANIQENVWNGHRSAQLQIVDIAAAE
jgi:single-stranded-DNA-specific exonuclease